MVIALVRLPSIVQNFGPVRQLYCKGLLRSTYVLAGSGENAAVLNQGCGVGLEMQGFPLTTMVPNCGKAPDMNGKSPASFQPPTTAFVALDVFGSNDFPSPTGNSHVPAMLNRWCGWLLS